MLLVLYKRNNKKHLLSYILKYYCNEYVKGKTICSTSKPNYLNTIVLDTYWENKFLTLLILITETLI